MARQFDSKKIRQKQITECAATAVRNQSVVSHVICDSTLSESSEDVEPPSGKKHIALTISSDFLPSAKVNNRDNFRKLYYSSITDAEWNDWRWQLANRVTKAEELAKMITLSEDERIAVGDGGFKLPFAVTPYYLSLINREDANDPLRKTVIPTVHELNTAQGEMSDPLGEEHDEVVEGLVHRYPDRVLFLATSYCSTYCRYCTRSRVVGVSNASTSCFDRWEKRIEYIRQHTEIRDVLISGGDPLTLSDKLLEGIISKIRAIPHVEIIRIGTKIPTVLPQRVTKTLVNMLKKYHPIYMSIHASHPDEFTPEAVKACAMLADAGIPLGSQTVLLKGVNDNVDTMKAMMHKLLMARVRPYYLYQCDPVQGTSHFRTEIMKGLEIIQGLRGHTTGYAVPTFVVDAPGGGGKIPVAVDNIVGIENGEILLKNFEGKVYRYPAANKGLYDIPMVADNNLVHNLR